MSEQHGRCRAELEQYTQCSRVRQPEADILADALDRIEARLDAESTAGQAARQTAERLIVADRDEWQRRAEFAERECNQARAERDEARAERDEWKRTAEGLVTDRDHWYQRANQWSRELAEARSELATARAVDDAQRTGLARLLVMEERYRPRRFPQERPNKEVKSVLVFIANEAWCFCRTSELRSQNLWCYAPPPPENGKKNTPEIPTAPDAAPAATADDGRDKPGSPCTPPVVGTGETATGEEKPVAWAGSRGGAFNLSDRIGGAHLWFKNEEEANEWARHNNATIRPVYWRPQPVPVVKLPRNPYGLSLAEYAHRECAGYARAKLEIKAALDAAGVKWEEE